jgi:type I restriction enzyme S subunit
VIRQWRALEPWIDTSQIASQLYSHPTVPLRNLLSRRIAPIDKAARPLDTLNIIAKVTFGGELFIRSEKERRSYKGSLFEALPSDLIISKIRVGQGSFCLIGDHLSHVAVSPEYPVYTPDPLQILPRFLTLVLRTPEFMRRLTGSASGNTTKRRIRPAFFESLKIPLPILAEQQTIVAAYDTAIKAAAAKEQAADAAEAKAMADFEAALGFAPPTPLPDKPIFIASFKDLDRWSHEGVLRRMIPERPTASRWPIVQLKALAEVVYGLQKHPGNRPGLNAHPYLRVANVQRGRINLDDVKKINVDDGELERLALKDGDLLFVEGNGSRANLGRVAVWHGEIRDCIHQNHLIRARIDKSVADSEFVAAWFNSDAGRAHFFKEGKTTSGLGTINSTVIREAPLPLPPLADQRTLIQSLDAGRAYADQLRAEAISMRTNAWAAFEVAVYAAESMATPVAMDQPLVETGA